MSDEGAALTESEQEELEAIEHYYQRLKERAKEEGQHNPADDNTTVPLDFLDDLNLNGKTLTWKEKLFVCEYLIDLNGKAAMKRAGFSKNRTNSTYMIRKPIVAHAIKTAMRYRMERLQITQDRVVEEYAALGFSNIGDAVDWDSGGIRLKAKSEVPRSKQRAIMEITETRNNQGVTTKVRMHDKKGALDSMARHMGMFNDKLKVEHSVDVGQTIEQARQRVIEARKQQGIPVEQSANDANDAEEVEVEPVTTTYRET